MKRQANRIIIILAVLILSACAAKKQDVFVQNSGGTLNRMAVADEAGRTEQSERIYVLTARQRIEVREIDLALKQTESVVQKIGGYVQGQSINEGEQAYLTLRVPASKIQATLDSLAALGNEESRSVSSRDVTEQYIDTGARLKNAVALRDRLKALLGQARDIKDVLEIEKELTRVQGDIDSMEGRMKKLKGQVDLAEIDLTLQRKKVLGPLGYVIYGIGWLVQKLFVIN